MKNNQLKKYSAYLIAFLPIGFYFYLLNRFAVNIPYYDDHALKAFILNYEKASTFSEKIQTLFQQHNEHRIVFTRFLTLIIYWIKGTIDYRWLMWAGNFTLIGILYFFWKTLSPKPESTTASIQIPHSEIRNPQSAIILPFLLFTQLLWENTYWGMASVQNFGVLFFVIGLFYFLTNDAPKDFNRAILFAVLATFTSGNGFLALPIALFLLILQKHNKRAIIFTGVSVLLAFLYFYHYKSPENPSYHGTVKEYLKAFLAFLGNVADFQPNAPARLKYLMIFGGMYLIMSMLYGIKLLIQSPILNASRVQNPASVRTTTNKNLFYLGVITFLLASALIVVVGRLGFGLEVMLTSRYKIYSVLLVMCLYSLLIQWTVFQKRLLPICILGAVFFNIWMNWQYVEESIYQRNRLISFDFTGGFPDFSGKRAIDKTVPYSPDNQFYDEHFQEILMQLRDTTHFADDIKVEKNNEVTIVRRVFNPSSDRRVKNPSYQNHFVVLWNEKRMYLIPTRQNRQSSKNFFLKNSLYFAEGFVATIANEEFESGKYRLGVVHIVTLKVQPIAGEINIKNNRHKIKVNW